MAEKDQVGSHPKEPCLAAEVWRAALLSFLIPPTRVILAVAARLTTSAVVDVRLAEGLGAKRHCRPQVLGGKIVEAAMLEI